MIKVAYQGEKGAYSQIALHHFFKGKKAKALGVKSFEEVFKSVAKGKCQSGVIPLENSLTGSIHQNYDLLASFNLKIVGEIYLKITHHLLVVPRPMRNKFGRLKMIKKVYSHPQALLQCQGFFKKHPWMQTLAASDTAGAAQLVAKQKDPSVAAIASQKASKIYGLEVLEKEIEDNKDNFTRFVVIGNRQKISKQNKVSLLFSLPHRPGALYKILEPFAKKRINLTKIESRPIVGKPWEYLFYLDFEAKRIRECLEIVKELEKHTLSYKVLGFYQKGKNYQS